MSKFGIALSSLFRYKRVMGKMGKLAGWKVLGAIAITVFAGQTAGKTEEGEMVKVTSTIFLRGEDGSQKVLGKPVMTMPIGVWARFRMGEDIPAVTKYSTPSIPEELADSIKADSAGKKPDFETNDRKLVIPAHPEEFETISLGLSGRFRPRLLANGNLSVDAEVEYRELEEWLDKPNPIFHARKIVSGKEKNILVTENTTKVPVISTWKSTVHFTQKAGAENGVTLPVTEPGSRPGDGELSVQMKVERVLAPDKQPKAIPAANRFYITSRFIEISSGEAGVGVGEGLVPEKSVLSDQELQVWIRKINQQKSVDLLSAPSVMVRSGEPGKVEVIREFIYPTGYDPPVLGDPEEGPESMTVHPATPTGFSTRNQGVSLRVQAKRAGREGYVELTAEPQITSFSEFVNFGQPVFAWQPGAIPAGRKVVVSDNQINFPVFHDVSMQTTVRIPDGSSVVLGGLTREDVQDVEDKVPILGDLPLIGGLGRSRTELHIQRNIFIVVTVTSVDSSGVPNADQ